MSATPTSTPSVSGTASGGGPRPLTDAVTEIRASPPRPIGRGRAPPPPAAPARAGRRRGIARDHPARGALGAGERPLAMADREDLLQRCVAALSRPGVNGFLGTAEIIEDLALLGALDGKLVWGSMNRIGLQGASFEMDDRFGAYDVEGIEASHLDGGKMLTRINYADPGSASTLKSSAEAIDSLSERGLNAMIEPFISRWEDGRIVNDLSEEAVIRSICIAQALGRSSAHTWLKLPCVSEPASMRRVMASTSLPSLILGGEVSADPEATRASWAAALELPGVRGLVVGRSLLYPRNDDVEAAVAAAVALL